MLNQHFLGANKVQFFMQVLVGHALVIYIYVSTSNENVKK